MKHNFLKSLRFYALVVVVLCGAETAWGEFTIYSGDVVSGTSYKSHTSTVNERGYVITFGGNNSSVGTSK